MKTHSNRHKPTFRQTDRQTNRHLGHKFVENELLESKVTIRTPDRQLQTDSFKQTLPAKT